MPSLDKLLKEVNFTVKFYLFVLCFETAILLPQSPEGWDHNFKPPYLARVNLCL